MAYLCHSAYFFIVLFSSTMLLLPILRWLLFHRKYFLVLMGFVAPL